MFIPQWAQMVNKTPTSSIKLLRTLSTSLLETENNHNHPYESLHHNLATQLTFFDLNIFYGKMVLWTKLCSQQAVSSLTKLSDKGLMLKKVI